MNGETVRTLLIHEIRTLVRDRRTIIFSVVLPLAVMPLMLFGMRAMHLRRLRSLEGTVYQYAIIGKEADLARSLIRGALQAAKEEHPVDDDSEASLKNFKAIEVKVADPPGSLKSKEIHFYLESLTGEEADRLEEEKKLQAQKDSTPKKPAPKDPFAYEVRRLRGVPLIRIHYQGDRDASQAGRQRMRNLLALAQSIRRDELLRQGGLRADPKRILAIENSNLASAAQVTGSVVGRFLTVFLMLFLLSGGAAAAMDIIAGEKERGSLETLLTTAATRAEIVAAKQLAIFCVALFITLTQIANLLAYVTFKLIELPKDFVIHAPPGTVATLLVLYLPLAALVSSVLLMISAYAKSYKEAQLYFLPVYLVSLFPALASVLPGISLRSAIALVPVANVSVATREILVGKFDWPMLAVTFTVMVLAAAGMMRASAKMLSQERLITAGESDAAVLRRGPALFQRHVLRWYALILVVIFTAAANELQGLRRQILFNVVLMMLGGALVMILAYRLNIREALALRPVKPAVWLATLLLIPSAHLVGVAVFRIANLFIPVPRQALEQFSRELLPETLPLWQMFLFLSILPGICEEAAFRGVFLYGVRRKFRPVVLAIVVGMVFGMFHVSLFRILPTGVLGIILTALALLTGSIFPCVLLHAGNNALALVAAKTGYPLGSLDWWLYAAAAAVFALAFYIIYRNRTPYPDLLTRTPK